MSDNIDITTDLVDGSNGALGDNVPQNAQGDGAQMQAPAGTQHVHGDAVQVNKVEQGNQPAAKEPSLRDQLSSAFSDDKGAPTDQANAQNVQTAAPALTKDNDGKYRLADGTFASQEQVTAFEAANAQANTQADTQQNAQQSPVLAGLTAQEAQQFQSLPAELRQYVERTMEGLNTRAARYAEYDQIEQMIGPRREAYAQQGLNPVVALNQLFALSDFAGRDPGQFVLWFSQQNNLDLDALLDARDAQQSADPQVQQLQGQVQQLTGAIQNFQQRDAQAAHQANYNAVETFATDKDANGALKRPYLTEVMDDWSAQITAVRTANPQMPNEEVLQRAYDNACWSNPTVRGKMQTSTQAQQQAQEAARVLAAKQAGSSVAGAPAGEPSTIPNNSSRTLREELEGQFAAARAV